MGVFSCFKGNKRTVVRNVQSAPPGPASHTGGSTHTTARNGRRSAPGLSTPSKDESEHMQTTPNSPREIPEEIHSAGSAAPGEVFDKDTLGKLSSETWNEREAALQGITERVRRHSSDASSTERLPLFNACCCILRKGMADKVAPVYFAACALLDALTDNGFAAGIATDDLQASIMPLMAAIVARTGETNSRVMECTCKIVLSLASKSSCKFEYVSKFIVQPIKSLRKLRLVWGRLELIRRTVQEFGISKHETFTAETIMPVVVPALSVAEEKVRKLAARLVAQIYRLDGGKKTVIVQHMSAAQCGPGMKKVLQRKFDQIDGKVLPSNLDKQRRNKSAGSVRLKPIRSGNGSSGGMSLASLPTKPLRSIGNRPAGSMSTGGMDMVSHPFGATGDLSPVPGMPNMFKDDEESLMDAILNE